jgi:glycosyltransferase involved in cell wall biosynthesis
MDDVGECVKVLYFTHGYSPHDRRFLTALAKTDWDIHYQPLTNQAHGKSVKELPGEIRREPPIQASQSIAWKRYPALIRHLKRRLGEVRPDIVHAGPIHTCAALTALSGFHPLVGMSWGSDLLQETRDPRVAMMVKHTLKRTDVFVGDCETVIQAAEKFGMAGDRVFQFPWGIDLQHFSPGVGSHIREELGWQDQMILLSTRSFEPIYGVDLVVKAYLKIARWFPELRLLLLGDGSQRVVLEGMVEESGIAANIHFAGPVHLEELPDYYRAADVYLSASFSDGSSVSLLEAMGCGLPVVVSDIPGNLEWVENNKNGWVFPTGDSEAIANVIMNALEDPSALDQIGKAGRKVVETRADWNLNFPKLLDAYRMALHASTETSP